MSLVTQFINLLNGNSKLMNVDGHTTPKVFSYSPGAGNSAEILSLGILLENTGNDPFNKFGNLAALSNGVQLSVTIGGVTTVMMTIKDNADFCTFFQENNFGSSAQSTLGAPLGFGQSVAVFNGVLPFNNNQLILTDTDSIQVTVQDNLSSIGTLVASISLLLQAAS